MTKENKGEETPNPENPINLGINWVKSSSLIQGFIVILITVTMFIVVKASIQGRSVKMPLVEIGANPTVPAEPTPTVMMNNNANTQEDKTPIDNFPFAVSSWVGSDENDKAGVAHLTIYNDEYAQTKYHLQYVLPPTATIYSGAGIAFDFNDPQNLTDFQRIIVDIDFAMEESRCELMLRDYFENKPSIPLSPNIQLNQDIQIQANGLNRIYSIPLSEYYGAVSLKDIRQITCVVDTDISPQDDGFTINNISFLK